MQGNTDEVTFYGPLEYLGREVSVAVTFSEDNEIFMLVTKDSNGKFGEVISTHTCSLGESFGDLVGSIEKVTGVPDSEAVIDLFSSTYADIKASVMNAEEDNVSQRINTVVLLGGQVLMPSTYSNTVRKNLLFLPLMAEMISGLIRDGKEYDFKSSDALLDLIKASQNKIATFIDRVMLYDKHPDPLSSLTTIGLPSIPHTTFSGTSGLFTEDKGRTFFKAFIPNTYDDLIGYLAYTYLNEYHFYCCANCRRYFAFKTDSVTKNCSRIIEFANYANDIGKTCHDVGRMRSNSRKAYQDDTQILYQRNYKAAFGRKAYGKISEESFAKWGAEARLMRDKCLAGEISYDELKQWFIDNYLRE